MAPRSVEAWLYGQGAANGLAHFSLMGLAICSPYRAWAEAIEGRSGALPPPCRRWRPLPYQRRLGAKVWLLPGGTGRRRPGRLFKRNFGFKSRERAAATVWKPRAPDSIIARQMNAERECGAPCFWLTAAAPEVENSSHVTVSLLPSPDRRPKWREPDHEQ